VGYFTDFQAPRNELEIRYHALINDAEAPTSFWDELDVYIKPKKEDTFEQITVPANEEEIEIGKWSLADIETVFPSDPPFVNLYYCAFGFLVSGDGKSFTFETWGESRHLRKRILSYTANQFTGASRLGMILIQL